MFACSSFNILLMFNATGFLYACGNVTLLQSEMPILTHNKFPLILNSLFIPLFCWLILVLVSYCLNDGSF